MVMKLSIAIFENGPLPNNKAEVCIKRERQKNTADEPRQIMMPLAEACVGPYFWDVHQANICEFPNIPDMGNSSSSSLSNILDDPIDRLVRANSMFNID
jgi:hypothetical protein